ncbi:hypothetical protein LCGC14_2347090, partial [marine sediment metagenome]
QETDKLGPNYAAKGVRRGRILSADALSSDR